MKSPERLKQPMHSEQQSDAPAELDQVEEDASGAGSETDRQPNRARQTAGEQVPSPDLAYTVDERARRALAQVYGLLLDLSREPNADKKQLDAGGGSEGGSDALHGDCGSDPNKPGHE